jgi:hypothetical protein
LDEAGRDWKSPDTMDFANFVLPVTGDRDAAIDAFPPSNQVFNHFTNQRFNYLT